MKIVRLALPAIFFILFLTPVYATSFHVFEKPEVKIIFEPHLRAAAEEVATIFPKIKSSLESNLGWDLNIRPSVFLIKDRKRFQAMALNPLIVGFAVPENNMIVIDYTKMTRSAFMIANTLKHELCHLLLHHYIKEDLLPRWLDEGIAQWASDGIGDIIMDQRRSLLTRAALRGRVIRLESLKWTFPADEEAVILAYEESKGFIVYLIGRFDKAGILRVLGYMKIGEDVNTAVVNALSCPLETLEMDWHVSLRKKTTWFTYLSNYLYEILFALMAFISIYAFIRIIIKKRDYMAEEPTDPFNDSFL